jgi:hypothetical protein
VTASKKMKATGWVISVLVAIFLIGPSALGKFIEWEGKGEMFARLGFTNELIQKIGVLEIALAVMLLIPRVAFLGGILLTAYLGGATVTHLRIGEPFFFPPLIGVVMWIGLACRRPEIFALATGSPTSVATTPEE